MCREDEGILEVENRLLRSRIAQLETALRIVGGKLAALRGKIEVVESAYREVAGVAGGQEHEDGGLDQEPQA